MGLRHADDRVIASHAQRERQCLVTGDFACAAIRHDPPLPTVAEAHRLPQHYAGLVVLMIPPTATAISITQWLDSFVGQQTLITQLSGKLAMVEPGRVRRRSCITL